MPDTTMVLYNNRYIFKTNTSIVYMDIKNKKVHGSVMCFDICSGRLNYSCEYKQNLPHGVYREYCDDQVQYEKPYINIMYNLEKVANTCANYVLAND